MLHLGLDEEHHFAQVEGLTSFKRRFVVIVSGQASYGRGGHRWKIARINDSRDRATIQGFVEACSCGLVTDVTTT